jgi:hypothetical protein
VGQFELKVPSQWSSKVQTDPLPLLDILRMVILIMLGTDKPKEFIIQLIDDAMIDEDKEQELTELLAPLKPILINSAIA